MRLIAATAYAEYSQADDALWALQDQCSLAESFGAIERSGRMMRTRNYEPTATVLRGFLDADMESPTVFDEGLTHRLVTRATYWPVDWYESAFIPLATERKPDQECYLFIKMPPKSVRIVTAKIISRVTAKPNPIL